MLVNVLVLSAVTLLAYALALAFTWFVYQYQRPKQRQRQHPLPSPIPYRDCWPAFILLWFSLVTLAILVGLLRDLP